VEGPTLADRIARGPIPVEDAAPIARQIAEALEAAHEQSVIHRDLKPANIKLRPDGVVKVLDFGLAKALRPVGAPSTDAISSPTATAAARTGVGVILGTPAYMAPEQAKGLAVDRRADIWAFGTVLYEMLSGSRVFRSEGTAETLASILREEIDWTAIPPSTPPALKTLMFRCLDRDPKRRLRDIGEARVILEDPAALAIRSPSAGLLPAPPKSFWRTAAPFAVAVLATAAVAGMVAWNLKPVARPTVTRFSFSLPEGQEFSAAPGGHVFSLSPDGSQIVYSMLPSPRLYLRRMSQVEVTPIPGTEGHRRITDPVFSPDGQSIAFYAQADRTIKRIPVTGGAAVTLCPADSLLGMSWGPDGIVFGQANGIYRISPEGGKPEQLVHLNDGEVAHGPEILPGGKHLLFTLASGTASNRWDKANVIAQSLTTGARKTLIQGGSEARYVKTGHLVYVLGGRLLAVGFDYSRLETHGNPALTGESVQRAGGTGTAQYSFSNNGSLAYIGGSDAWNEQRFALITRKGEVELLKLPPGQYLSPRASPDGRHIAFGTDNDKEAIVWIYDLTGGTEARRLTFGSNNRHPVWSADGKRVAFQSDREGDLAIFSRDADGIRPAERLTRPEEKTSHVPESWSPDGKVLLYSAVNKRDVSLWMLSLKDKSVAPFGNVHSAVPTGPVFSPDGRWVAYSSGESFGTTIYVQPFPATGSKYQLPAKESDSPHEVIWSNDGKELIYNPRPRGFEAVPVNTKPTFTFGHPVAIPRPFQLAPPEWRRTYDITPSGKFVGLIREGYGIPEEIRVVLNWFDELTSRVPVR
jgi:serine/threonine-protein kinase